MDNIKIEDIPVYSIKNGKEICIVDNNRPYNEVDTYCTYYQEGYPRYRKLKEITCQECKEEFIKEHINTINS